MRGWASCKHDAPHLPRGQPGDPRRQFARLGAAGAGGDQVLDQPDALGLRRVQDPAGQHHIGHPRRADQPGEMHGRAAADIDAAACLRQREERRGIRDAQMAGARDFQPAADHRAVQHRDRRNRAAAQRGQAGVPGLRVAEHGGRVARLVLGQIEAGTECGAMAVDDDRASLGLGAGDGGGERGEQRVIDRVALGGAVEADPGDAIAKLVADGVGHAAVYRACPDPGSARPCRGRMPQRSALPCPHLCC